MFTEKYTSLKCFTTPSGQCANVPMMQVVDTFNYKNLPYLDAQAVVLPYNVRCIYLLTLSSFLMLYSFENEYFLTNFDALIYLYKNHGKYVLFDI